MSALCFCARGSFAVEHTSSEHPAGRRFQRCRASRCLIFRSPLSLPRSLAPTMRVPQPAAGGSAATTTPTWTARSS